VGFQEIPAAKQAGYKKERQVLFMARYKTCSDCGSNIDFSESCDCGGKITVHPRTFSPQKPYKRKIIPATPDEVAAIITPLFKKHEL